MTRRENQVENRTQIQMKKKHHAKQSGIALFAVGICHIILSTLCFLSYYLEIVGDALIRYWNYYSLMGPSACLVSGFYGFVPYILGTVLFFAIFRHFLRAKRIMRKLTLGGLSIAIWLLFGAVPMIVNI